MSEQDIINEIKRGNINIYSKLVDMYKNMIFSLAYKFTNDYDEAQDLSQEIFIKIFNNLSKFRFESSHKTWIYKIATNMCIDYKKKQKKQSLNFNEDFMEERELDADGKINSPEEIVISDEKQRAVHRIIHKLPDIYKTVIIMYHFNESSYKEISKILDISEKTVETRLYRARRLLRNELFKKGLGGETGWDVDRL